ncbi:MAG: potassium channel protein [Chloroflexota bacterium]
MPEPTRPTSITGVPLSRRWRARIVITRSHLRLWLLLVIVAIAFYTALYMLWDAWSLSDALYMTVITLTTVGFKEVRELDEVGRWITMAAALSGAALIFGGVGIMAETLVADLTSGRRERRRMQQGVDAMRGHWIVCGYGRVGSTVARELRQAGRSVVVLDVYPESVEKARVDGYPIVEGDATDDGVLRLAGIDRAAGLVASIDSDANNVYVVLSARTLNPGLFIVGRAAVPSAEAKLQHAGADRIVSPYTMAGRRIAELATRPAVVDFIDAALSPAQARFSIEQRRIEPGSAFDGRTVSELADRGIFTLALVLGPNELDPHPPRDRRLHAGDELIVSASVDTLDAFLGDG